MVLEVEALAAGGRGIAAHDGKIWFVAGALPGDRVEALLEREHPRFVEARVRNLLRPSTVRRSADCPVQAVCGGCPWMTLAEGEQRHWKRRIVTDALARIGGMRDVEVAEVAPGRKAFGYRNKVELSMGRDGRGRAVLGFRKAHRPSEIVDVTNCPVQSPRANAVLAALRQLLLDARAPWRSIFEARDETRIVIRHSRSTGESLVALRTCGPPFPSGTEFARRLMLACSEVVGVVELAAPRGRRGGTRTKCLAGQHRLLEQVDALPFELPAASFLQVNTEVATEMVREVTAMLEPVAGTRVLDLYAGVGTIGLNLARRGASVTLSEADRSAVAAAMRTARRHRLRSTNFQAGDVTVALESARPAEFDAVVANPPRAGLGPAVIPQLLALGPPTIVLVSCDPATLARDVRRFTEGSYRVRRVVPFDMFPQTHHVETVLDLRRESKP